MIGYITLQMDSFPFFVMVCMENKIISVKFKASIKRRHRKMNRELTYFMLQKKKCM